MSAMSRETKLKYFEYTLFKLDVWFKEKNPNLSNNDIGILKALKLLFFVTAAKSNTNESQTLIKAVFDNYCAMPYGHVESDIYDLIKINYGNLNFFKINNSETVKKANFKFNLLISDLDNSNCDLIDRSVDFLKHEHSELISMTPFNLVELSHQWYSWQKNYNLAKRQGLSSMSIKPDEIIAERKILSLQTF